MEAVLPVQRRLRYSVCSKFHAGRAGTLPCLNPICRHGAGRCPQITIAKHFPSTANLRIYQFTGRLFTVTGGSHET